MQKSERHNLIIDLIGKRKVGRQEELAALLSELGFEVTQASVSRDLDELGIVKVKGRYARTTDTLASSPFGISGIQSAGENLIVVRCSSGLASAAAVRIDAEQLSEIVGTIAGDDTIFIAVADKINQKSVINKLRKTLLTSV